MATLIEKTITTQRRCPKNHKVLKRFQIKDGTPVSYYFYCETCRKRYEESRLTRSAAQRKNEKSSTKGVVIVSNNKINQKSDRIIRNNANGPLKVIVDKSGSAHKKCPHCSVNTLRLTYEVKESGKKIKKLAGKECPECHRIYFGEAMYAAHSRNFILVEDNSKMVNSESKEKDNGNNIEALEEEDKGIKYYNKSELLSVELVQAGVKLPKSCYRCNTSLVGSSIELKKRNIDVKVCNRCKTIYMHNKYFQIYRDFFVDGNEQHNQMALSTLDNTILDENIKVEEAKREVEQGVIDEDDVVHIDSSYEKKDNHTDDFGNEFDFSELNHLLNL